MRSIGLMLKLLKIINARGLTQVIEDLDRSAVVFSRELAVKQQGLSIEQGQDWHPSKVIAELHKKGLTLSKIAEEHKLTNTGTLSKSLRMSFPIAEKRIADALGLKPQDIWPSRFLVNGERKQVGYRRIKPKNLDSAA